ncbi:LLM class flavin-dependent oxidoreductase [Gluconacetobacter entanii]|uniref:LLM class flavin-dependent oxidoreductase n=1 Tax=Gluconacetobacter entanii TaxID=108528 RepID=A0ABT3K8G7_9PROT|nr:LLM class flavin-dependent oxidoreductase [Gluconacetobacter entanii]MCW4591692.1 LLM class flavin-dependent oxidoreductase [Gluconacetobacter entanii]MCW4593103.1 LLM class flavin-dependent oxidoreductase [Gluconacetobacter entanii]NPC89897.1 LLM class flavin-dependent oxidoreductase [Gluconacetobacter entanii]
MMDKPVILGLSMRYLGYHAAGWRHLQADPSGSISFDHYRNVATRAEKAGFAMVFLADGVAIRAQDHPHGALAQSSQLADLEPLTLLSALSSVTTDIGLVATASTTYNEPYHIARKYASLGRISGGRAGWNIVTSWSDAEARNFGMEQHPDYETRYGRAREFVDVVTKLWKSWDVDALKWDKRDAVFQDPAKIHAINHRGTHFSVSGPLDIPVTPSTRPLLVQAGASQAGMEIAARHADIVYAVPHDIETAVQYRQTLRDMARGHGRDPDSIKVLTGITPYVGRTHDDAQKLYDTYNSLIPPELGLSYLYAQMGDLSAFPLDGPVPEPTDARVRSIANNLLKLAREKNLTIRELYGVIAAGFGARVSISSARGLVDEMQAWLEAGASDGFNICPPLLPLELDRFIDLVIPHMRARGMLPSFPAGTGLRRRMNLPEA